MEAISLMNRLQNSKLPIRENAGPKWLSSAILYSLLLSCFTGRSHPFSPLALTPKIPIMFLQYGVTIILFVVHDTRQV